MGALIGPQGPQVHGGDASKWAWRKGLVFALRGHDLK